MLLWKQKTHNDADYGAETDLSYRAWPPNPRLCEKWDPVDKLCHILIHCHIRGVSWIFHKRKDIYQLPI